MAHQIHAFSPLGPPLIGSRSSQIPLHNRNRRRSSTVAGLEEISQFRQTKHRRPSININPTTTKPTKPSRLLTLPPELRNKIYETLFSDPDNEPLIKPTYTLPGLLKTCRQIYTESISLYYSSTPHFRCLDEASTISWLTHLPRKFLEEVKEIRYDTRWIIFITPLIPVPGAECWLFRQLVGRLEEGLQEEVVGKMKISFYGKWKGSGNGIVWTDKPGLVEGVQSDG